METIIMPGKTVLIRMTRLLTCSLLYVLFLFEDYKLRGSQTSTFVTLLHELPTYLVFHTTILLQTPPSKSASSICRSNLSTRTHLQ